MKRSRIVVLLMIVAILSLFVLSACNPERVPEANNLAYAKVPMSSDNISETLSNDDNYSAYTAFSAKLLNAVYESKANVMVSPLSIYLALAMTANAADGETLTQMASSLGLSVSELNTFCGNLYSYFMETDKNKSVNIANSIWCNESMANFSPKEEFLQANSLYYGADVFKTPFEDLTKDQINQCVNDNTDGMIKNLLDEIDTASIAYLINTLLLNSNWDQRTFYDFEDTFTDAEGSQSTRSFLTANDEYSYLHTNSAVALRSNLKNGLCFVGILPNGTLDSYIENLNGSELKTILTNEDSSKDVNGKFPTFNYDYAVTLNDTLTNLGMGIAFDEANADFSKGFNMPETANVFISEVLHKTRIEVTKYGVRAAAATSVSMGCTSAAPRETITISLDRPFAFALIDTTYNIPLFIGTYNG